MSDPPLTHVMHNFPDTVIVTAFNYSLRLQSSHHDYFSITETVSASSTACDYNVFTMTTIKEQY